MTAWWWTACEACGGSGRSSKAPRDVDGVAYVPPCITCGGARVVRVELPHEECPPAAADPSPRLASIGVRLRLSPTSSSEFRALLERELGRPVIT